MVACGGPKRRMARLPIWTRLGPVPGVGSVMERMWRLFNHKEPRYKHVFEDAPYYDGECGILVQIEGYQKAHKDGSS